MVFLIVGYRGVGGVGVVRVVWIVWIVGSVGIVVFFIRIGLVVRHNVGIIVAVVVRLLNYARSAGGSLNTGRTEVILTHSPPSRFWSSYISYTCEGSLTSRGAVMIPNSTMQSKFWSPK